MCNRCKILVGPPWFVFPNVYLNSLLHARELSTFIMVLGRITAAEPVSLTDSTMSLVSDIVCLLSEDGRWYLRSLSSRLRKQSRR